MKHFLKVVSGTPVLDTSAYGTGDRMGSIVTLSAVHPDMGGRIKISSLQVIDLAKQNAQFDILLFDASPTVASADNAAIDIADAEIIKLVGVIPVLTADYTTAYAANSQATKSNINLIVKTSSTSNDLYMLLVSRGAPTYAASDLIIKIGYEVII